MSAGTRTIVNRQGSSETTNGASLTSANNERMMNAPLAHQARDRNRVPSSRTCLGDFEESVADFVSIGDCELSVIVAGFGVFGVFGVFRGLVVGWCGGVCGIVHKSQLFTIVHKCKSKFNSLRSLRSPRGLRPRWGSTCRDGGLKKRRTR